MHTFELSIGEISKIEGKARLVVRVKNGSLERVEFAITEFKRFYTQAIRGKHVMGLPQLCCRICGTCSNAHLLCAILAAEHALGIEPTPQTGLLRELVNYGLIIRDHALHCYVFALPDLFGVDSILELNENDPLQHQLLHDTFQVKAAGNALSKCIGGRSVHAPYPTIGGFSRLPDPREFPSLITQLTEARAAVFRLISTFLSCDFLLDQDVSAVAVLDSAYTFLSGDIEESGGKLAGRDAFGSYLEHVVIPYSHASGYRFKGRVHLVGALARVNLGKNRLHAATQRDAHDALSVFPSRNIYHNTLAQAIEILHAIDRSVDILRNISLVSERPVAPVKKAGKGTGVIEAPRGTLYYNISVSQNGTIDSVRIVVPTGQNQIGIEKSLTDYIRDHLSDDREVLIRNAEQIIRAYDPCMSCASHFLKVRWISR